MEIVMPDRQALRRVWQILPENRDHDAERSFIKKAMLELRLWSTLGTGERHLWLPEANQRQHYLEVGDFRIVTRDHRPSCAVTSRVLKDNTVNLRRHLGTIKMTCEFLPALSQAMEGLNLITNSLKSYTETLVAHSRNIMRDSEDVRARDKLYAGLICRKTPSGYQWHTRNPPCPGGFYLYTLLNMYMELRRYPEDVAMCVLSEIFPISGQLFSGVGLPSGKTWFRCRPGRWCIPQPLLPLPKVRTYDFLGKHGEMIDRLVETNCDGKSVIVPVTYWMRRGCSRPFQLTIPFQPPCPLYQLHLVHVSQTIYLTDSIQLASAMYCGPGFVWTSWYGGAEAVSYMDWEPLRGKSVYYVLSRHSGHSEKDVYETAVSVCDAVRGICDVQVIDCM